MLWSLISSLLIASAIDTEPVGGPSIDLTALSLEELLEIEVTSVSRKEEKLFEAAAAVYVITGEEIRRSGAASIPEVLRMAPGMEVARIDANKWAVTARGFNNLFSNKLLVLIDGRSVYTPIFSGVFWDMQDVVLEDLDRIEVIRGPGATMWGANAVNGVINIITRNAQDTQGTLITAGVGSEERAFAGVRYGGQPRDETYCRVYLKYSDRDDFVHSSGTRAADGWAFIQGGVRMDWAMSAVSSLTLQGDLYRGDAGQTYRIVDSMAPPYIRTFDGSIRTMGGNVLARWEHDSSMTVQAYYDRADREEAVTRAVVNTIDLDVQQRAALGRYHEFVGGIGYRFMNDRVTGSSTISFDPETHDYDLISAFLQDDISLIAGRLKVTLGSKFEQNDRTGWEIQPNVRVLYIPHGHHMIWGAISRAVRTPCRAEDDMRFIYNVLPPNPQSPDTPIAFVFTGSRDIISSELLSLELGYRVRPTDRLFIDAAAFCHRHDNLTTFEPGKPFLETAPAPEHTVLPYLADNKLASEVCGVELLGEWWISGTWHLKAAYTGLKMDMRLTSDGRDLTSTGAGGKSPRHQFFLRSSIDLSGRSELDLNLRYVDELPTLDVERYVTLDARLGWRLRENVEISAVGQNLLSDHHAEFVETSAPILSTEVEQGIYGTITWQF